MRRLFVTVLAFLTVAITGGSCEFRASTGTPIQPQPPVIDPQRGDSGLLIVVNTGDAIGAPSSSRTQSSHLSTALAVSVLSAPDASTDSANTSNAAASGSGLSIGPASMPLEVATSEQPIPEPDAILLFGLGTLLVGWSQRSARRSRRPVRRDAQSVAALSASIFEP
jgi:hypothetical protein